MRQQVSVNDHKNDRPREWRRRVLLTARMRAGSGWDDIRILNVSSRGLLIQAPRLSGNAGTVELRHGDQTITARVVWRDGARFGLQADDRISIEQILAYGQSMTLQLPCATRSTERRQRFRAAAERNRLRGRALEFASVAVVVACIGLTLVTTVADVLARPMAAVRAALGN